MPGGSSKTKFMQRCVGDVAGQGKELGAAFAICTAQSQKSGYSEPGSSETTAKGKARDKFFAKKPDMKQKAAAYEKAVGRGRKQRSESMADVFAALDEARATSPDEDEIVARHLATMKERPPAPCDLCRKRTDNYIWDGEEHVPICPACVKKSLARAAGAD